MPFFLALFPPLPFFLRRLASFAAVALRFDSLFPPLFRITRTISRGEHASRPLPTQSEKGNKIAGYVVFRGNILFRGNKEFHYELSVISYITTLRNYYKLKAATYRDGGKLFSTGTTFIRKSTVQRDFVSTVIKSSRSNSIPTRIHTHIYIYIRKPLVFITARISSCNERNNALKQSFARYIPPSFVSALINGRSDCIFRIRPDSERRFQYGRVDTDPPPLPTPD